MESVLKGYKFSIILLLVFGSFRLIQEWTTFLKVLGRDNTKYKIIMHICIFCVICSWWTLILGAYTEMINWHSCRELENSFVKCDLAPTEIFTGGWQHSHLEMFCSNLHFIMHQTGCTRVRNKLKHIFHREFCLVQGCKSFYIIRSWNGINHVFLN